MAKIIFIEQIQEGTGEGVKNELQKMGHEVVDVPGKQLQIMPPQDYQLIILAGSLENIQLSVSRIRAQQPFQYLPVIGISPEKIEENKLKTAFKKNQIDDIIFSPSAELVAIKIDKFLDRLSLSQNLNPLTGLPGNPVINKKIKEKIIEGDKNNAIIYFDLNNFKAYNDYYGFLAGDWVIKSVANIVQATLAENLAGDFFVGHIGGDDFVTVLRAGKEELIISTIIDKFEQELKNFYQPLDYERGCIISYDRNGRQQKFGLMGLTFVSFSNRKQDFKSLVEVGEFAGVLKHLARNKGKKLKGSIYLSEADVKIKTAGFSLLKIARNSKIPLVLRRAAIEAMGEAKETQHEAILVALLDEDLPYLLKKSTIYALGRLRSQKALPKLLDLLKDPNPHLRTRAVEALGNTGLPQVIPGIENALKDSNVWTRRMAALTLGKLGERRVIPTLKESLKKTNDGELKKNIIISLGELQDKASGAFVLNLVSARNPSIKKRAIWALGRLKYEPAVGVLLKIFKDELPEVKYEIGLALRELVSEIEPGLIPEIVRASYDNSPAIRRIFVDILGDLEGENVNARLIECLHEKSEFVRWHAVLALAKKKKQVAIRPLIGKLKDRSVVVKLSACYSLGELNSPVALNPLRLALKDEDLKVRQQAAEVIIKILKSQNWEPKCPARD